MKSDSSPPRQMTLLFGEEFDLPFGGPAAGRKGPALGTNDPLPPGPFVLGMLYDFDTERYELPFSVKSACGQTVAGHIPSLEIAKAVRDALNQFAPTEARLVPLPETIDV